MCVFPTISVLFVLIAFIPLLKSLIWSHILFISLILTCFNCRLFILAQRNWQKKTFWWFLLFVGSGVRYKRSWDEWRQHTRKDSFIHPIAFLSQVGPEPSVASYYAIVAEKAMAPHSSILAWKISWTEELGRLQSMLRAGYYWVTSLSLFNVMDWRSKWQPTPVLLSGECQGRGSLVGCNWWGRRESDMTEVD